MTKLGGCGRLLFPLKSLLDPLTGDREAIFTGVPGLSLLSVGHLTVGLLVGLKIESELVTL